jgi:hypothetical protein
MQWCRKKDLAQAKKTDQSIQELVVPWPRMPLRPRKIKDIEKHDRRIDEWETAARKVRVAREEIKRVAAEKLYVSSNQPSIVNFAYHLA